MLRREFLFVVGLSVVIVWVCPVHAVQKTQITYEATSLGGTSWQYVYHVSNTILATPIREFTIWFDYSLYENLVFTTPDPLASAWDELVIQPELVIEDDGFYDALTETGNPGIGIGETVSGFSVSFDWLGTGNPGSQFYEIIDPDTFATSDSGWTVPEPVASLLLIAGCFGILRRRRNN